MMFALGFLITPATGPMPGIIEWSPQLRSFSLQSALFLLSNDRILMTPFSVLPGIAFSLDLIETTGKYGVAEVLLSSAMAAGIFSVFGGQPLCIAGVTGTSQLSQTPAGLWHSLPVTGPITVLNKTIYDLLTNIPDAPDYLQFMGWVYLWGAIFHWMSALLNCG